MCFCVRFTYLYVVLLLIEVLVEPGVNIPEEEAQMQAAGYVCWEVLPTLQLYYKNHYSSTTRIANPGEDDGPLAPAGVTDDDDEVTPSARAVRHLLHLCTLPNLPHQDDGAERAVSPAQFGEELAQLIMLLGQEAAGLESVVPPQARQ